jgi:PAS domain S-box-containing protein
LNSEWTNTEIIYSSSRSIIVRAINNKSETYILKKTSNESVKLCQKLKREYDFLSEINSPHVIKAIGFEKTEKETILILENVQAITLKKYLEERKLRPEMFIDFAIQITEGLKDIHAKNIIHKDINPANILIQNGKIIIIDLNIAEKMSIEDQKIVDSLEGTINYVSPEQTGKLKTKLDLRTDIYSLGITFYEMITGFVPFSNENSDATLHDHISKIVANPKSINNNIPKIISAIIMKLIEKDPQNRYQSTIGLKYDLNLAKEIIQSKDEQAITLGKRDVISKIDDEFINFISETDIRKIERNIQYIKNGIEIFTFSPGFPSQKNSPIVNQLINIATTNNFLIIHIDIQESLNHFNNYILRDLIRQFYIYIRFQSKKVNEWVKLINEKIGDNFRLILDLFPEFSEIIGEKPELQFLTIMEEKKRFFLTLKTFIGLFSTETTPLVFIIKNIHLADTDLVELFDEIFIKDKNSYLWTFCEYQRESFDKLNEIILNLKKKKDHIDIIKLQTIKIDYIQKLIEEKFWLDKTESLIVAKLMFNKTNGDPYSLNLLLKNMINKKILYFDYKKERWIPDIEKLNTHKVSKNVVSGLLNKLNDLDETSKKILFTCACIGKVFTFGLLLKISKLKDSVIKDKLNFLTKNNFLTYIKITNKDSYFEFFHNELWGKSYHLFDDNEKDKVNIVLFRFYSNKYEEDPNIENMFNLVQILNQINNQNLIENYKAQILKYNILAGKEFRKNSYYKKALVFYKKGLSTILNKKIITSEIQENFENLIEAAELSYTNDDEKYLMKLIKIGVRNAKTNMDKVNLLEIKLRNEFSHNLLSQSLQTGVQCANLLNFRLGKNPTKLTVITEYFKTKLYWSRLNKKRLSDIPESHDPTLIKLVQILLLMSVTAYITKPNLLAILVFKMMRILPMECPKAGIHFFAGYGMILCGIFNDISNGYKMGNLAINLIEKYDAKEDSGRTIFTAYSYVYPWKKHMVASLNPLLSSMETMYKAEDFEYYSSALLTYTYFSFFVGKNLPDIIERVKHHNEILLKHNQIQFQIRNSMWGEFFSNFANTDNEYLNLNGQLFNETASLPDARRKKTETTIFDYCLIKMILGVFFYEYDKGYVFSKEAANTLEARTGSILKAMYYFYDSLLLLNSSIMDQSIVLEKVNKNQIKIKKWSSINPKNFLNKYLLIEAEMRRKMHKYLEAEEFFEKSIQQAKINSFIFEEALAKEFLAKLYIEKGIFKLAIILLQEAIVNYQNWGADNKVKHIYELYKNLFSKNVSTSSTTITTFNSYNPSKNLIISDPILQTYQTIAGEINLENLLRKLMKIILRNSGANRAIILTKIGDQIFVNAESSVNENEINIFSKVLFEDYDGLSHLALNKVIFTSKYLLIDNLANNEINYEDKYFKNREIKSLLCLPLINNKVIRGYLYLENKFVNSVFTKEKLRLIEIIASQLATSLNMALLYQNIEQSEEKYRTLVDNLKDGVYIIQNEKIIYVNKALLNMLGRKKEEILATHFSDLVAPKYKEIVLKNYHKRLQQKVVDNEYEIELLHKTGEKIPVILSSGLINYNDNIAIEGTVKDITEQKLAQEIQKNYNKKLEYQINKKTQDIRYLLDNAKEGFLSINNNLLIDKEFSKECQNIFELNIANRDFVDLVFSNNNENEKKNIRELFNDIFNATDNLSIEVYTSLLPEETIFNGKYLRIIYNYLNNKKIMVIITDITNKRNLEIKVEREQKNLKMIVKAITDSNLMKRSINDYIKYFTTDIFEEMKHEIDCLEKLNIIFRKVHTFKGDLSQWDMSYVTSKLSKVEDILSDYLKNSNNLTYQEVYDKISEFKFIDWINKEINIITERIGKNIFNENDNLLVDKNAIFEIENYVIKNFSYDELTVLLPKIRRLRYINFKSLILPYSHYIDRLAEKLGKLVNPLEICGDDILVDYDIYYDFSKTIVHLFRNMLDHGIESPEERLRKGLKSEIGNIKCNFIFSDSKIIIIEISDDGAGIDINSIKNILVQQGNIDNISEMSEEDIISTIFNDGFTTKEASSEISGRGVGMSAIKSEVEKLGGNISILTKKNYGTTFKITLPFIEKNVREKIKIDFIIQTIEKNLIKYFEHELAVKIEEGETTKLFECNVNLGEIAAFIDIKGMVKTRIIFSLSESKAMSILKLQYPDAFEGENLTELAKGNIAEILNIIIGNSLRSLEKNSIFISIGTPIIISGKNTNLNQSGQSMIIKDYNSKYGKIQMLYEMDSFLF